MKNLNSGVGSFVAAYPLLRCYICITKVGCDKKGGYSHPWVSGLWSMAINECLDYWRGPETIVLHTGAGIASPILNFRIYQIFYQKYKVVVVEQAGYSF